MSLLYAYEEFDKALEDAAKEFGAADGSTLRCLNQVRFAVLLLAWTEMEVWREGADVKQIMSWAWEDMMMAFTGYGDSVLTGAVVHYWNSIEACNWVDCVSILNKGKMKAESDTSLSTPRRYLLHYRVLTVRSPDMGFDQPCLVPIFGPRMQEWARKFGKDNGVEPATVIAKIEEIERLDRQHAMKLRPPQPERVGSSQPDGSPPPVKPRKSHLRLV